MAKASNLTAALAALDRVEQDVAAIRAALGGERSGDVLVPLGDAIRAWNVEPDTARARARRGAGQKLGGRWHVWRSRLPAETDNYNHEMAPHGPNSRAGNALRASRPVQQRKPKLPSRREIAGSSLGRSHFSPPPQSGDPRKSTGGDAT